MDYVKIDKTFIHGVGRCSEDEAITLAIIAMAHSLGLKVVAEGVEYESQRELLKQWGCDKIQGYLISRPLDPEGAIKLLKEQG